MEEQQEEMIGAASVEELVETPRELTAAELVDIAFPPRGPRDMRGRHLVNRKDN